MKQVLLPCHNFHSTFQSEWTATEEKRGKNPIFIQAQLFEKKTHKIGNDKN